MQVTLVRDRAVGLLACAAGVVLAARQVTLFRLDEPLGRGVLAVAIITVVLAEGLRAGMRPVYALTGRAQKWARAGSGRVVGPRR
jgi:ABC-type uncharacterized transport system permease subunit